MQVQTYGRYTRSDLGLTEPEWERLQSYISDIQQSLATEADSHAAVEKIEEGPPSIDSECFRPNGWIGRYPGDIDVVTNRLDAAEEESLIAETQEWIEIIGATAFEAAFPVSTDLLIDDRTRLAGYSKALIELTEIIRSNRLPTTVNRDRTKGIAPNGRPILEETMKLAAQGSREVVTEQLEFSFETLQNYLLVRFHAALAARMRSLCETYDYYRAAFEEQLAYHESFLNEDLPSKLLDTAVEIDFSDPTNLSQVRREATAEDAEIVDLWEAFQQGRSMELRLSENLNTAVKPISKIYELWCLRTLLEVISDVLDEPPASKSNITGAYSFGSAVTLYYNRRIPSHSNYLRPAFGVGAGEPDFALAVGNEIAWVGDAKFKVWDSLQLADYQRFITYLVDLLGPGGTGTILYVDPGSTERAQWMRDYRIQHIALRANNRDRGIDSLQELLEEQISDALAA